MKGDALSGGLSMVKARAVLAVTMLHELCDCVVHLICTTAATPSSVVRPFGRRGELGSFLEAKAIGGMLEVAWSRGDEWNLDRAADLVIDTGQARYAVCEFGVVSQATNIQRLHSVHLFFDLCEDRR